MEDIKGNLRGITDSIIKIKIRSPSGEPQHSAEFRLNDRSSLIGELRILKDKFGVDCFEIKGKHKKTLMAQQQKEARDELDSLKEFQEKDWREKTKGLREPDKEFQEKMKKAL